MIDLDSIEAQCKSSIANGYGHLPVIDCGNAVRVIELIARLRQSEKDAARYRWLRDVAINSQVVAPLVFNADECANPISLIVGDHLDYAVDRAMQCER